MRTATVEAPTIKILIPIDPAALPRDLIPPEGQPPGENGLDLVLPGGSFRARARLNARNYRKILRQIDDAGPGNIAVTLQGVLRAPDAPDGPFVVGEAGFQAFVRPAKPAPPPAAPPAPEAAP